MAEFYSVGDTMTAAESSDPHALVGGSLFRLPTGSSQGNGARRRVKSRTNRLQSLRSVNGRTQGSIPYHDEPSVMLRPGGTIAGTPYRIERWLGEGSMGTVYEGLHEEIERRVALKVLHPRISGSVGEGHFRDEARASARINAPNIVEVYDFKTLADGRELIAMEYLDGAPLSAFEGEPMEASRVIGILRQICKGLHAAHQAGLIHRDIKPDNIMLITRQGRRDFVKIVDFGLCAALEDIETGAVVGTPRFMAPEVIEHLPVDERSDMYSLGGVAYQLLTGRPPFETENIHDLLSQHLFEQPPSPSVLLGKEAVPRLLESVILRCLAKNREDRFRDMADLEAALLEAQIAAKITTVWDDLPVPDVDETRREAILRGMPDATSVLGSARWIYAALAILLVGFTAAWALWPSAPETDNAAQLGVETPVDLLDEAAHVAAAKAFYIYPEPGDPDRATAYRHLLQMEGLDDEHRETGIERAKEIRQEFAGTLTRLGDTYWDRKGGQRFAIDYYIQALLFDIENERARERAGITPGELAWLRKRAETGEFTEAELIAAEFLQALADPDAERRTSKLRELRRKGKRRGKNTQQRDEDELLASLAGGKGTAENAAPAEEDGTTTGGEVDETDDGGTAVSKGRTDTASARKLVSQADASRRGGRWQDAERKYIAALGKDNKNARAYAGLGEIAFQRGQHNKAVKHLRNAVRYAPRDSEMRIRLGDALYKVMRLNDALKQYKKAAKLGNALAPGRVKKVEGKLGK